jgi:hypothetical protein
MSGLAETSIKVGFNALILTSHILVRIHGWLSLYNIGNCGHIAQYLRISASYKISNQRL